MVEHGDAGKVQDVASDLATAVIATQRTEHSGVGGSNPSPRTTFHWPVITLKQPGGLPECPYFYRWVIDFGAFSVRLHWWRHDDDHRAAHDHPYSFWTLVLWGGYDDVTPDGQRDRLYMGSVRFRPAEHRHAVHLRHRPTITLVCTGPPRRRWGFWVNDKLVKRDKYFAEYGHHPCDPTDAPVRMRPDGSRI